MGSGRSLTRPACHASSHVKEPCRDNHHVEIRNYLRSARGPQDAAKAYGILAGECERNLNAAGISCADVFQPWSTVVIRAQSDSTAVEAVKATAELLKASTPLRPADPDAADATAIAMAYGYAVRALDLTAAVASLAAGWCWLQWIEASPHQD